MKGFLGFFGFKALGVERVERFGVSCFWPLRVWAFLEFRRRLQLKCGRRTMSRNRLTAMFSVDLRTELSGLDWFEFGKKPKGPRPCPISNSHRTCIREVLLLGDLPRRESKVGQVRKRVLKQMVRANTGLRSEDRLGLGGHSYRWTDVRTYACMIMCAYVYG